MLKCVALFLLLSSPAASAEILELSPSYSPPDGNEWVDVIYLKNGTIVRGYIVNHIVNESITIRLLNNRLQIVIPVDKMAGTSKERQFNDSNPHTARGLSCLIPGFGQFYNKESGKGFAHLIIHTFGLLLMFTTVETDDDSRSMSGVGVLVILSNWIVSMTDAYSTAHNRNIFLKQPIRSYSLGDDKPIIEIRAINFSF